MLSAEKKKRGMKLCKVDDTCVSLSLVWGQKKKKSSFLSREFERSPRNNLGEGIPNRERYERMRER